MKIVGALFVLFFLIPVFGETQSSTNTSIAEPKTYDFSELETGSDDFGSYSIGHNLTTNGRTLKKGQTSIGSLYFAHGLTDDWSFGTSLFVLQTFKMFNLMSRHGYQINPNRRVSLDLAYFKTFGGREIDYGCEIVATGSPPDCYKFYSGFLMEAANAKITLSEQMNSWYRLNTTFSYFYYWDDRSPFSFRMDPANGDPYTTNLSTLHEFRLRDSIYINYELGMWGLNYQYPYLHTGLTLGVQTFNWLFSIGGSTTYSFGFPEGRLKNFPAGYTSRASFHPEFEIQYFF